MPRLTWFAVSVLCLSVLALKQQGRAAEVAITLDDPNTYATPLLNPIERNAKILAALAGHSNLKAALFVCGNRIDNPDGRVLLKSWDDQGHLIANHTYSHSYFNGSKTTVESFAGDLLRTDGLISGYANFKALFRFPYLKEGNTAEKRDHMRQWLREHGYRNGYVTIDASDWYISDRMEARLKVNPKVDLTGYRDYYLAHIWQRANYYDELALEVLGRKVKHTLLIHHNLLNALFLDDLLAMFKERGWKLIDASQAYGDPAFSINPNIVPAGESLIWALAKQSGRYEKSLRYPGEDEEYEKPAMDRLGL